VTGTLTVTRAAGLLVALRWRRLRNRFFARKHKATTPGAPRVATPARGRGIWLPVLIAIYMPVFVFQSATTTLGKIATHEGFAVGVALTGSVVGRIAPRPLLLLHSSGTLGNLNLEMLRFFLRCLDIQTPIVKASDYEFTGTKSDLVLDMCVKLGAELYIFGAQGRNYADSDKFRSCGVEPCFQQYNHPNYRQLYGDFLPYMSVIDLLFNEGPASRGIILAGNVTRDDLAHQSGAIVRSESM